MDAPYRQPTDKPTPSGLPETRGYFDPDGNWVDEGVVQRDGTLRPITPAEAAWLLGNN